MMMSNFPFCVDYLNREREEVPIWIASTGLLFDHSARMLQEGNDWCSLWCGKSFLVPMWIATWRLLLNCCARKLKRREFVQSWERVSLFQCGFLHQDWFLTVLYRYCKRTSFSFQTSYVYNFKVFVWNCIFLIHCIYLTFIVLWSW